MPRVKLFKPKSFDFETILYLRIYDINYGGHMGNDTVLRLAHEARIKFLNSLDLCEKDFYGSGLIMADSAIVYKQQAFYGDKLTIQVSVTELYPYGFDLFYLIINTDSNLEVARLKTGLVCYDYIHKKVVDLSPDFKEKFG
tara:strand:- start:459 stop:881 length:423 start_codon:yes stop_codon:yes gene_type:complete